MKSSHLISIFLAVLFVGALVGYYEHQPKSKVTSPELCVLEGYSGNLDGLTIIGEFDGVKVYDRKGAYVIDDGKSKHLLNASSAFFFDWGFIAVQDTVGRRTVPLVLYQVNANSIANISARNATSEVPLKVLMGCTYDGKPLWDMEFPGYVWAYERGSYTKYNGTAVPDVLAAKAGDYLYVLVLQSAPKRVQEVRKYAPSDYLYVFGENGTVKELNLGKGTVPARNAFIVANGTYVLLGFERPQPDGSPQSGYVEILNGTEVLYRRLFQMTDPTCLCHVIPGWGRIDKNGCATFGLYDGYATYCNGTLTFHREGDNT